LLARKFTLFLFSLLLVSFEVRAQSEEPRLFEGFWSEAGASFTGTNLLYHLGGVASTPLIIKSGLDSGIHNAVKSDSHTYMFPGAVIGSEAVAAGIAYPLYHIGKKDLDYETLAAAYVIVDSALLTLATVSVLKFFSARTPPDIHSAKSAQELSEEFSFGFGRRGIFTGWPSGHVSHTVAVTSALAHYYPEKTWLKWTGVGLSTYMVATVSTFRSGQMHWFSDAVAGAMMGYAIGSTVGKKSRERLEGRASKKQNAFELSPVATPEWSGLSLHWQF
jgi:membrane-associated phospholipid phosphatase